MNMNKQEAVRQVGLVWSTESGSPTLPYLVPRYRISLVRETEATGLHPVFRDSASAVHVLRPYFEGLDREQFLVCCLDAGHAMIGVNVVSVGSLTLSIVHPREVLKPAILLNACALIAAHNHPSGDPTPSPEDRTLTARLRRASKLLGITLLDHLILAEDRYYSFADHHWPR